MRREKGFTLVEVMIVVAVINVLAALVVPNAARARQSAEDTKTQAELRAIYEGILMFQIANGFRYPTSWAELQDYITISNVEEKYELNPN